MTPPSAMITVTPKGSATDALEATPSSQEYLPLVCPVAATDTILQAWRRFHDLRLKLLDPNDFTEIRGERFAKKSAFRKLALAYGISTECVREDRIEFKSATAYLFTIKAMSPNGRSMIGSGSCHSDERRFTKPSDCRATAETRATNRAIANLLGWAQISAEEVVGTEAEPSEYTYPSEKSIPQAASPDPVHGMTQRQRALLVALINQRVVDPEERETALQAIDSYSKEDASEVISSYLEPQAA